jgi:hypothetical protein
MIANCPYSHPLILNTCLDRTTTISYPVILSYRDGGKYVETQTSV